MTCPQGGPGGGFRSAVGSDPILQVGCPCPLREQHRGYKTHTYRLDWNIRDRHVSDDLTWQSASG